ncbi:MAG: site-specific integrase [Chloroflexota bacterium]|nr:site-specific integrase [Chloroflexota bacterium]
MPRFAPLKWEEPEIEPLTREEAARLLEAIRGQRLEGLAVLVLATGLREQEALGLQAENIDLEKRWLRVRTALSKHEGRYFLKGLKTRQSRPDLRIPEFAVPALKRWLAFQKADQERQGDKWSNELSLFFTNEKGGPLNATAVGHTFQRILAAAGLGRKRFYDLRHGMASYMNAEGHQYRQIQAQLGWSNLSMLPRYTHLFPGDQDRVAVTLDNLFSPSKN